MLRKKNKAGLTDKSLRLSYSTTLLDQHLDEILEEVEEIRELEAALKNMSPSDKRHDDYEARFWVALTHLEHHVKPAIKEWDRVVEQMPE